MTPEQHLELVRAVRPKIRKLARQGRAVDEAFKAVQRATHPDADPARVSELRAMFFAGAAELLALQMYGVADGPDATEDDYALFQRLTEEIERRHGRTLQLALAEFGEQK